MSFNDWHEQQRVTEFLYHEARLLDAHRWAEWLDLFTPDGLYWMSLVHGQTDHLNHASLFLEDTLLRSMRVRRLAQARAYSQQPVTRTAHVTGNVSIASREPDGITVASTLHVLEWRKGDPRSFGGSVLHTLKTHGESWRIHMKRIDLINCEAPHEALQVFL